MDDGKPLVVSIFERDGALFLSFVKTDEGLLAEGASAICTRDGELEARFSPGTTTFGPAAHWGTRYLLEGGIDFTLTRVGAAQARIETMGWSATFAALRSD
ncbi:MAG TPA: hypothetical protein VEG27_01070 [Usitatibacter sp.]|nr:hypothetical protein [Usitatibacter sp.]